MTKEQFFRLCEGHDWFYQMSDDHGVYMRGATAEDNLKSLASTSVEFTDIYNSWAKYYFSGKTFGTERAPKPVLS